MQEGRIGKAGKGGGQGHEGGPSKKSGVGGQGKQEVRCGRGWEAGSQGPENVRGLQLQGRGTPSSFEHHQSAVYSPVKWRQELRKGRALEAEGQGQESRHGGPTGLSFLIKFKPCPLSTACHAGRILGRSNAAVAS